MCINVTIMSELFITLVNVTINAYPEKRPRKPEKKYEIEKMFNSFGDLPMILKPKNVKNSLLSSLLLETISVCLPGGRGCVGKNRHGSELQNRQVVMKDDKGVHHNPTIKDKVYGLLVLSGKIFWNDGTCNNMSIPVDASGVIGLRMGVSKQTILKPYAKNPGYLLVNLINDFEYIFLNLLNIEKERPFRIENINCNFNLYTNLKKEKKQDKDPRPRIKNYSETVDIFYREFINDYKKPLKPFLMTTGTPAVYKSIFKTKIKGQGPTFSISPYGVIEMQGIKTFDQSTYLYKKLMNVYNSHKEKIKLSIPQSNTTIQKFLKIPDIIWKYTFTR